ncbi:MAG: hypothetical protein N3A02_06150 [Rectinema sp.]|nr:hypothetical protein [Rectinema sp.]
MSQMIRHAFRRSFFWMLLALCVCNDMLSLEDPYIIYIREIQETTHANLEKKKPAQKGDAYEIFLTHPEQTFLDTVAGPLPLYFEAVYDAEGNPRPRFPHYLAKQLFDDPTEETALRWLAANAARARRLKESMYIVRKVALQYKFVTPEAVTVRKREKEHPESVQPIPPGNSPRVRDWGAPLLSETAMRNLGFDLEHPPLIPGLPHQFEVIYFWDHRKDIGRQYMLVFARFAHHLRQIAPTIGIKTIDIAVDDPHGFAGHIRFFEYEVDEAAKYIKTFANFLDYTNLKTALRIRYLPMVLFVDRRTDRLHRVEGAFTVERLQKEMDIFLGVDNMTAQGWKPARDLFLSDQEKRQMQQMWEEMGYASAGESETETSWPEIPPPGSEPVPSEPPDLTPWSPGVIWKPRY